MIDRQKEAIELLADFISDNDIMFDNYSTEKDGNSQITSEEIVDFLREKINS